MHALAFALAIAISRVGEAQPPLAPPQASGAARPSAEPPAAAATPGDFVIGPNDVLTIVFWRDKDMSGDVAVRPDGKVSLPLLNEVQAAGFTPERLRQQLTMVAARFIEDPTVTVVVKEINSRKVFITGQVGKPGSYALSGPMTVLQLIAMAGGVLEYANSKNIVIMRTGESGRSVSFPFNYRDVTKRKNLKQNIELRPGDTIIVP